MPASAGTQFKDAMAVTITLCGALAKHLPAHVVRGFEADLRAMAGARRCAGDAAASILMSNLATSLVTSRPELFGH